MKCTPQQQQCDTGINTVLGNSPIPCANFLGVCECAARLFDISPTVGVFFFFSGSESDRIKVEAPPKPDLQYNNPLPMLEISSYLTLFWQLKKLTTDMHTQILFWVIWFWHLGWVFFTTSDLFTSNKSAVWSHKGISKASGFWPVTESQIRRRLFVWPMLPCPCQYDVEAFLVCKMIHLSCRIYL